MEDIRELVRSNLVRLRKEKKLTQLELSQRINYSDKAISRWETGEVTPDVETLAYLATIYEVPITTFFLPAGATLSKEELHALKRAEKLKEKEARKAAKSEKNQDAHPRTGLSRRVALFVLSLSLLWTAVLCLFFSLQTLPVLGAWRALIWGVPGTFLILVFFLARSRHRATRIVFSSLFVWTLLTALYLQISNWWLVQIFFLGIPLQAAVLLLPFINKKAP